MKSVLYGKKKFTIFFVLIFGGAFASVVLARVFFSVDSPASEYSLENIQKTKNPTSFKGTRLASGVVGDQITIAGVIKKENGEFFVTDDVNTYKLNSNLELDSFTDKKALIEGVLSEDGINVKGLEVDGIVVRQDAGEINISSQTSNPETKSGSGINIKTEESFTVNGEIIKVTPSTDSEGGSTSSVFIEGSTSGGSSSGDINVKIRTSQDIDSNSRVRIRTR